MSAQTELAKRLAMRLKALESAAPSDLGRKLRIASKNYFGDTSGWEDIGQQKKKLLGLRPRSLPKKP